MISLIFCWRFICRGNAVTNADKTGGPTPLHINVAIDVN